MFGGGARARRIADRQQRCDSFIESNGLAALELRRHLPGFDELLLQRARPVENILDETSGDSHDVAEPLRQVEDQAVGGFGRGGERLFGAPTLRFGLVLGADSLPLRVDSGAGNDGEQHCRCRGQCLRQPRAPAGAPDEVACRRGDFLGEAAHDALRLRQRPAAADQKVARAPRRLPFPPLLLDVGADAIKIGVLLDDGLGPLPAIEHPRMRKPHRCRLAFTGREQDARVDQRPHQGRRGIVVGGHRQRHRADVEYRPRYGDLAGACRRRQLA